MINIDLEMTKAAKARDFDRLNALKMMKCEIVGLQKNNVEITDAVLVKTFSKMIDTRVQAQAIYEKNFRPDLAAQEAKEIAVISEYMPQMPDDRTIVAYTDYIIRNELKGKVTMRDMKSILAEVQKEYPLASGKIVSEVVKKYC